MAAVSRKWRPPRLVVGVACCSRDKQTNVSLHAGRGRLRKSALECTALSVTGGPDQAGHRAAVSEDDSRGLDW